MEERRSLWLLAERRRKEERELLYEDALYLETLERIAENLSSLRRMRGLTQEEAAHSCRVTTRLYQRLEAAESNVTLLTLVRVARGLDADVVELFTRGQRPPTKPPPIRRQGRKPKKRA